MLPALLFSCSIYPVGICTSFHLTVVLLKSVRTGDYAAKYLSDISEKTLWYPSWFNWHPRESGWQCLHQLEGVWISGSTMIHNTFLVLKKKNLKGWPMHFVELDWINNKARQEYNVTSGFIYSFYVWDLGMLK